MRILMVAAEVAPFARVGGMSDVIGALSKELALSGHEVAVMLPKYRLVDEARYGLAPATQAGALTFSMGGREEEVELLECRHPACEQVRVFFVRHDGYFDREGIYTDPATGEGYPDEVERYALFSRAALESALALDIKADIIHLNDHHTALVAAYKETLGGALGRDLSRAAIVLSIHNLGYQGVFDRSRLPGLGFSEDLCTPGSPFEFYGRVNSLKVGLSFADMVNTVSETYADEISESPEYGLGLEGILAERRRAGTLVGIVNGVDYSVWDPSIDTLIPARYTAGKLKGKRKCKAALLRRSRLQRAPTAPLIGMVSRLVDQKGFDLMVDAAPAIVELGACLVVLGTGQERYHEFLKALASRYPKRVAAFVRFDNELAHWIEAGSDMFLMPSRYEPCGLNQLYSLRYGTIPIVRATGGLADTVSDVDLECDTGTGFVFTDYTSEALLGAVERAVSAYRDRAAWERLIGRSMAEDFSWGASAAEYVALYERAGRARLSASMAGAGAA